jgi:hypothetical protein
MFPPLYIHTDGSVLNPDLSLSVGAVRDTFGAVSGGAVSGVRFSDLPIKVARAIQEKAPTSEVGYITTLTVNNQLFYQVSFQDSQRNPQLIVREDGVIIDRLPAAEEMPRQPFTPISPPGVTVQ